MGLHKQQNEFGTFGTASSMRPRGTFFRRFFRVLVIVVCVALFPYAYGGWRDLYDNFLERDLPIIKIAQPPVGLGKAPLDVAIDVRDLGSGLDEVIIRGEQGSDIRELKRVRYDSGEKRQRDRVVLTLPGRDSGFKEGSAKLIISAFDRSFWTNGRQITLEILVDYSNPEIEVITTQHNAVLGGAELVFYRLREKNQIFSGIKAGRWLFPGFQADKLDPDFNQPDVYFALFAVPLGFDTEKETIRLFARDSVGNVATSRMYYKVLSKSYPRETIELSEKFLRDATSELIPRYYELERRLNAREMPEFRRPQTNEELVDGFRLVNENYRELLGELLRPIFERPKSARYWSGNFMRPGGSARKARFGVQRTYTYDGLDAGGSLHAGVDLASKLASPVRAANGGMVIFADDLGIYGKTVILDHGFGLTTMYSHLSSVAVQEGDRLNRGSDIGKTGQTGLAAGDHLHFETRVHGVPVRPVEWWDKKWIEEHIEAKIAETKKILGIPIRRRLEEKKLR